MRRQFEYSMLTRNPDEDRHLHGGTRQAVREIQGDLLTILDQLDEEGWELVSSMPETEESLECHILRRKILDSEGLLG